MLSLAYFLHKDYHLEMEYDVSGEIKGIMFWNRNSSSFYIPWRCFFFILLPLHIKLLIAGSLSTGLSTKQGLAYKTFHSV